MKILFINSKLFLRNSITNFEYAGDTGFYQKNNFETAHNKHCCFAFYAPDLFFAADRILLNKQRFFSGTPAGEIRLSFLLGLRFDIAALFIINIPVLFLYNFPCAPAEKKWYKAIILVLFLFINIVFIAFNIADFGYFAAVQRRLMYEPYTVPADILRMVPSEIGYHYYLFIVLLISIVLFIYSFIKLYSRLERSISFNRKLYIEVLSFVILALVSVTAIRGGFQMKPLRQANAFITDSRSLGYLTLNTTYNVVLSAFEDVLPDIDVMQNDVAEKIVMEMVLDKNEIPVDTNYVFMRRKTFYEEPDKLNVIIFIMESWSAKFSGAITGGKSFTPFFDSLASQGMLFTNFFATGQRSIEAIPSILTSVPSLYNTSIINSTAEMNSYRGLGSILRENGYTTSFHHGASVFRHMTRIKSPITASDYLNSTPMKTITNVLSVIQITA